LVDKLDKHPSKKKKKKKKKKQKKKKKKKKKKNYKLLMDRDYGRKINQG